MISTSYATTWLSASSIVAICLLVLSQTASAKADHDRVDAHVVVEHAELLMARPGLPDALYVTIYNGTEQEIALKSVRVDGYSSAKLIAPDWASGGSEQTLLDDADVPIPHKAELDMEPDGVFISLEGKPAVEATASMRLDFSDGTSLAVPLRVLKNVAEETRHHHGEVERE